MARDWRDEIVDAVHDLDNEAYHKDPCAIIFYFGTNDDGERYVDAEIVEGFPQHNLLQLAGYIGAEDFVEALKELNRECN